MQTELTAEERSALAELERDFGYAAAWGCGSEPALFALRAAALGPPSQSYVSIFFRALHRLAAGLEVSFEDDVDREFRAQPSLSSPTREALTALVAEYFEAHPEKGARVQLVATFGDLADASASLARLGVRHSARQIVAISEGRWFDVDRLRRSAVAAFAMRD